MLNTSLTRLAPSVAARMFAAVRNLSAVWPGYEADTAVIGGPGVFTLDSPHVIAFLTAEPVQGAGRIGLTQFRGVAVSAGRADVGVSSRERGAFASGTRHRSYPEQRLIGVVTDSIGESPY